MPLLIPFSISLPWRSRAAAIGLFLAIWACMFFCAAQSRAQGQAQAATGPFSGFSGHWSGTGTIRQGPNPVERIRCTANYRVRGSAAHDIDLQLRCAGDSYNFDLAGQFEADASNQIGGRWTEYSRNIGGTVIGRARGDRIQIHVESSAFAANMVMVTRGRQQSVSIDTQGGGQSVKASITLRRS